MRTTRMGLLLLACLVAGSASAFKMGHKEEYELVKDAAEAHRHGHHARVYQRTPEVGSKFGDPIHEEMSLASLTLAASNAPGLLCKASSDEIWRFARKIETARVGNSLCCAKSADSKWCNWVDDKVRYADFPDRLPPLLAGTRWPDDPCHMSTRRETVSAWAAWMVDPFFRWSSNINYSSHFHNKQFLHAMKSAGFGSRDDHGEPATVTLHKLITWAEFAMKVADGSIASSVRLPSVPEHLEPHRKMAFQLGFGGYGEITVGKLFAGSKQPDPEHVKQIALGALLHTVQDSFSLSHAERENARAPLMKDRGKITRFITYRGANPSEHGLADARPADALTAELSDAHPVAYGAHLIACAASSDDPGQNWLKAKAFLVERVFAIAPAQNRASAVAGR
jgi:hypothetical protein